MEAQGYPVQDNLLLQDNKSTILLEENGKMSSSKRTRHVNICYSFITDRIKKGEVRVQYCPTESMVADYFSKPLQGRLFRKLRNKIMNCEGDDPASWLLPSPSDQDHRSVLGDKDLNELADQDQAGQASGKTSRHAGADIERGHANTRRANMIARRIKTSLA